MHFDHKWCKRRVWIFKPIKIFQFFVKYEMVLSTYSLHLSRMAIFFLLQIGRLSSSLFFYSPVPNGNQMDQQATVQRAHEITDAADMRASHTQCAHSSESRRTNRLDGWLVSVI